MPEQNLVDEVISGNHLTKNDVKDMVQSERKNVALLKDIVLKFSKSVDWAKSF